MNRVRLIAFYLPQYYPTETNNRWYGEGFTEWTNVKKAKPLFKNHYQPKIPSDLGYYDLRDKKARLAQANLAKYAGIEGFCYYHYWFGEGKRELDVPFDEVVALKEPDFPFCLCWANQSWYSKFWSNDINCEPKLIVEQKYDNEEWIEKHFYSLLSAFSDPRYIRVMGGVMFLIYRPLEYDGVVFFMEKWRGLAKKNGLGDFYFVGQATTEDEAQKIMELGFDGVNIGRKDDFLKSKKYSNKLVKLYNKFLRLLGKAPYHYDYNKIYSTFISNNGMESQKGCFPTLIPNWDHSPRSGKRAVVFENSTPENFEKHVKQCMSVVENKEGEENIVFLKSWNEWGEGNYVEPCRRYGLGYINVLKKYFDK